MTTLRPFGPSVAFTASAMMFTPLSSALRASSSNLSCFGMDHVPPYSRMARTSSSRRMRYSLSSILTSEPEYFPNRILSPAFTSRAIFLPFSPTLPLPTAITLASCGFSLAVSGMMIPPFLTSFSSSRSTRMRSCSGRIFMVSLPPSCFVDVAPVFLAVGLTIPNPQRAVSTQTKRVLILAAAPARIKRKIRKENRGKKSFRFKCFAPRGVDADPQRSFRRLQRQPDRPFKTRADRPPEGQGWPHLSHHQLDRRRGPGGSADREGGRQCGRRLQQHRGRRRRARTERLPQGTGGRAAGSGLRQPPYAVPAGDPSPDERAHSASHEEVGDPGERLPRTGRRRGRARSGPSGGLDRRCGTRRVRGGTEDPSRPHPPDECRAGAAHRERFVRHAGCHGDARRPQLPCRPRREASADPGAVTTA